MRNPLYVAVMIILLAVATALGRASAPSFNVAVRVQTITYTCWTPDHSESFALTVTLSTAVDRWNFSACTYLSEKFAAGRTVVEVDAGASGVPVVQSWPDGVVTQYTIGGTTEFAMGPSNCDPAAGRTGALSVYIGDVIRSDVVTGMCLPLSRHVVFILSFVHTTGQATPTISAPTSTPASGTPTATIPPGTYVRRDELHDLVIGILQDALKSTPTK